MDPLSPPLITQQGISSKVWDTHKETIRRLYLLKKRNLSDVANIMEWEYGFRATYV